MNNDLHFVEPCAIEKQQRQKLLRDLSLEYLNSYHYPRITAQLAIGFFELLLHLAYTGGAIAEDAAVSRLRAFLDQKFADIRRFQQENAETVSKSWALALDPYFQFYGTEAEHWHLRKEISNSGFQLVADNAKAEREISIFRANLALTRQLSPQCMGEAHLRSFACMIVANDFRFLCRRCERFGFSLLYEYDAIVAQNGRVSRYLQTSRNGNQQIKPLTVQFVYTSDKIILGLMGLEMMPGKLLKMRLEYSVADLRYFSVISRRFIDQMLQMQHECILQCAVRDKEGFVCAAMLGFRPCGIYDQNGFQFVEFIFDRHIAGLMLQNRFEDVLQELNGFARRSVPRLKQQQHMSPTQAKLLAICGALLVIAMVFAFRDPAFLARAREHGRRV